MWGSYPASLGDVGGSTRVPAGAWNDSRTVTWGLRPPVKTLGNRHINVMYSIGANDTGIQTNLAATVPIQLSNLLSAFTWVNVHFVHRFNCTGHYKNRYCQMNAKRSCMFSWFISCWTMYASKSSQIVRNNKQYIFLQD